MCEAFKLYRPPGSRCIFDMENVNMTTCLMAFFVFFMCFSLLIVCPHLNMVVWAPLEMFIPPPFLIPIALLLWTQKTAISASLARSDRIKPNCMTPDLASICIHCCRPDWMSKANNMNRHHFGFLNFYCGGVFTSFVSIPSFHKNNAFFKHFKQNRVRAVYQ